MASRKVYQCRLCMALIGQNQAASLFTNKALQKGWITRIGNLLEIPVVKHDKLSPYMCDKCATKIESLERAVKSLAEFRATARCSLESITGPFKRPKETSGSVGVSPDTLRQRPSSKRRLTFTCKEM